MKGKSIIGLWFRPVLTWSPQEKKARLCRIYWRRAPGGDYFSRALSVNLRPSKYGIFQWVRECEDWFLTILFVQIHLKTSCHGNLCP